MLAVPTLHVRNVPLGVYERLRARAARNGRSINAETIVLLEQAVRDEREPAEILASIDRFRAQHPMPTGELAPERIIRRFRDGG